MRHTYSIPGVYSQQSTRAASFPRVRTDVVGFVGVGGKMHLNTPIALEDWKSYVAEFETDDSGNQITAPEGAQLGKAIRDFFANGGRRCWVLNVATTIDAMDSDVLLNTMLGLGDSLDAHGLELLLKEYEVSLVVIPDLDATRSVTVDLNDPIEVPGNPCFMRCGTDLTSSVNITTTQNDTLQTTRIYSNETLLWAQRYLVDRLDRTPWRWFALLSTPPGLSPEQAVKWKERLTRGSEVASAAIYWPWLLNQDSPGSAVERRSPVGAVAGVFAHVDVEEGPHRAPANKRLMGVVGLEHAVGPEETRIAYDIGVNVLRAFESKGIHIWGARTLLWRNRRSSSDAMCFVNGRRCLSAIARTADVLGKPMVFEPNTALLRIKIHQVITEYLLRVYASGALLGDQPEQGFFVSVDTVEESNEAQLVCRIGVALSVAAEFIEFRIGRQSGVIETAEAA